MGIADHEEPENPLLQRHAHRLAMNFQRVNLRTKSLDFIDDFLYFGLMALTDSLQFGFLISALVQQLFLLLGREVPGAAAGIPFLLVTQHQSLEIGDFIDHFLPCSRFLLQQQLQFGRLFQTLHLMVDSGDFGLAPLEFALRVQQVIDWWHEIVMPHTASQIA